MGKVQSYYVVIFELIKTKFKKISSKLQELECFMLIFEFFMLL